MWFRAHRKGFPAYHRYMSSPVFAGGGRRLSSRQARRWSARLTAVGVTISPARLRQLAAGSPATAAECTDFAFALTAVELRRERRHTTAVHVHDAAVWLLVQVVVALLVLLALCSMAYLMLSMAVPGP